MDKLYYVVVDNQQYGPYTIAELASQKISRSTLIWTEGQSNWLPASQIPELNNIVMATPPPLSSPQKRPPIPQNLPNSNRNNSQEEQYFGYKLAGIGIRFGAMLVSGIIMMIPTIIVYVAIMGIDYIEYDLNNTSPQAIRQEFIFSIISVILGAIFYPISGGNLGHIMFGLQVISVNDGKVQKNIGMGLAREGLKNLFAFVLIPIIWLLWDKNKQNLYDKVTQTYVVIKGSKSNNIL